MTDGQRPAKTPNHIKMREDLHYLYTFQNIQQLELATTVLRANGIVFHVEDEFVTQTMNVLATGYSGGARLFVQREDVEKAGVLLEQIGINPSQGTENQEFGLIKRLRSLTSGIPLLKKLPPEYQVPALLLLFLTFLVVGVALAIHPGHEERLTDQPWCVKQLVHRGEPLQPNSTGLKMVITGGLFLGPACEEYLSFTKTMGTRQVSLPGLNCFRGNGEWRLQDGKILLSRVDETPLKPVYEGEFTYRFTFWGELELTSPTTKIVLTH